MKRERYDHKALEKTSQEKWEALRVFETNLTDSSKEPYYLLFEFPYPSGDLHIGHWYAYAVTDIFARMRRMQGYNVLFPIGFDSFGLPAENAAIKNNVDPREWTYKNIERMRSQIRSIGASLDWSKEIVTSDPSYYQWTQWLFGKFFEHNLAYRAEASVKWCPKDKTVLANEQVVDGKCERCDSEVEEKKLTQWFMKITDYAERLLADLDALPWREDIKQAQRAWIGKSEGAKLWFPLAGHGEEIEVFTTRPDTVFGATYVVLAPEHSLVDRLTPVITNAEEVKNYVATTSKKTERERSENKEKTGVKLEGVTAINPATKEEIPLYVADYVLASYGTGAVMAVPAHDERDYAFAKVHNLPLRQVIVPCAPDAKNPPKEGLEEIKRDTVIVHVRDTVTGKYALLQWHESLEGVTTAIMGGIEKGQTPEDAALQEIREEAALEARIVQTLPWITAARYCASHKNQNRCAHTYAFLAEVDGVNTQGQIAASEQKLHTLIWVDKDEVYEHLTPSHQKQVWTLLHKEAPLTGEGYLINSGSFDGKEASKVRDDIITFAGGKETTHFRIRDWLVSRQRYWGCPIPIVYDPEGRPHLVPEEHLPWLLPEDVDLSLANEKAPLASSQELHERVTRIFGEGWTPEYDTLDTFVDSSWYFLRYLDANDTHNFTDLELAKKWMPVDRYSGGSEHTTMHLLYARFFYKALYDLALVPTSEPFAERFNRGLIMGPDGQKMSKRWGNIVNPDDMLEKYGADAVRMYLAFVGPYNEPGHYPWKLDGVEAMRRFLDRIYHMSESLTKTTINNEEKLALAKATDKITRDGERFKFNTAISALMVCVNDFSAMKACSQEAYTEFLKLLAPFAPHLAEHLFAQLGQTESIHTTSWPVPETGFLEPDVDTVSVQVNGKKKGNFILSKGASEEDALAKAKELPGVSELFKNDEIPRVIYVPGRILSLVTSS